MPEPGFPESYKIPENVSDAQLYGQAGNSVTVPVVKELRQIVSIMREWDSESKHAHKPEGLEVQRLLCS